MEKGRENKGVRIAQHARRLIEKKLKDTSVDNRIQDMNRHTNQ